MSTLYLVVERKGWGGVDKVWGEKGVSGCEHDVIFHGGPV